MACSTTGSRCRAILLGLSLICAVATGRAQTPEAEIRATVLSVNQAYAENDLPAYWSHYDASLTQWWPEGRVDLAAYQRQWTEYVDKGGRVLDADVSDLRVQIAPSGDAAVATYRLRVTTRAADGTGATEDIQETDVLFRRDGAWKIVHLHYSVAPPRK